MKQLNVGRFAAAAAAVAVAYYATNGIIHGPLLGPFHEMQPIFRGHEQMMQPRYIGSMIFYHLLFAAMLVWIFHFGWQGRKWEGLRYGVYMWLFTAVAPAFLWYALLPVGLTAPWEIVLTFPQMILLGYLAGAIYKPRESA